MPNYALILTFLLLSESPLLADVLPNSTAPQKGTQISETVVTQVEQAIEDELYDYRRERLYFEIDGSGGGVKKPSIQSVFVSKELSPNGVGVAVYKDMPYGEIYRYFVLQPDGLVKLSGDSEGPFRNTGGSFLTVFMPLSDLCDFVMNKSVKGTFTVNPLVSRTRIQSAVDRQIQRTGFSFRKWSTSRRRSHRR